MAPSLGQLGSGPWLELGELDAGAGRLLFGDALEHLYEGDVLGLEGAHPRQELVQRDPEGVDVRPGVDVDAGARLRHRLRREVRRGPEHPLVGEERAFDQRPVDRLGDPEVEDLGNRPVVLFRDQDVGGLQVPVHESLFVGVLDSVADRLEELEPLSDCEPFPIAVLGDRDPVDQLHDEVRQAVFRRTGLVEPGDVGVMKARHRLPLGLEADLEIAVGQSAAQHLQGHAAPDRPGLLGAVDDAHSALAEPTEDPVRPDALRWARKGRAGCGTGERARGSASAICRFEVLVLSPVGDPVSFRHVRSLPVSRPFAARGDPRGVAS